MRTAADYETYIRPHLANLEDENERLRAVLNLAADSCERDRREPDKILCHVLTMRRETLTAALGSKTDPNPAA